MTNTPPMPSSGAPWREVRTLASTGSTNADLMRLADRGEPSGLVLVAQEQTDGRGRLDRGWSSPPGAGLWFSVLVRTPRPVADLGVVPLLVGAAVSQAVDDRTGLRTGLKWPNDVMVEDRKLGGVLVQHSPTDALVIGVGLNTALDEAQRPIPNATSLHLEGIAPGLADHDELLAVLLGHLGTVLAPLHDRTPWPDDVLDPYRARCRTLGTDVVVHLPSGEQLTGTAKDVDPTGALVVETPDGERTTVTAGDVVHVR